MVNIDGDDMVNRLFKSITTNVVLINLDITYSESIKN